MDVAKLLVRIQADTSQLVAGMAQGERVVKESTARTKGIFTDFTRELTKQFSAVGGIVGTVADGVNALVTGSGGARALVQLMFQVGGALKASVEDAVKWESAFAMVKKVVDGSDQDFKNLANGLRDMSMQMPVAATQLAEIAANAGQLGIQKEALLGFTETMAKLASTTNLTAEQGSTMMAQFKNVMKFANSEFENVGNTLVGLGAKGASTESQIMETSLRLSGMASMLKIPTAEVLGLGAAIADVGLSAELGGTNVSKALREIDTAVKSGGPNLQRFAEMAGMSATAFANAWKEAPARAFQMLLAGLKNLNDQGKDVNTMLDKVGLQGIETGSVLLRLAGNADGVKRSLDNANESWKQNNEMTEASGKRYQTVGAQWEIFKNKMTEFSTTVGEIILPPLAWVLEKVNGIADGLVKGARAVRDFLGISPAGAPTEAPTVDAQTHAAGGLAFGPGGPTDDKIPAWLSNGEYVINAETVRMLGVPFFHALNRRRFAQGGYAPLDPMEPIPYVGTGTDLGVSNPYEVLAMLAQVKYMLEVARSANYRSQGDDLMRSSKLILPTVAGLTDAQDAGDPAAGHPMLQGLSFTMGMGQVADRMKAAAEAQERLAKQEQARLDRIQQRSEEDWLEVKGRTIRGVGGRGAKGAAGADGSSDNVDMSKTLDEFDLSKVVDGFDWLMTTAEREAAQKEKVPVNDADWLAAMKAKYPKDENFDAKDREAQFRANREAEAAFQGDSERWGKSAAGLGVKQADLEKYAAAFNLSLEGATYQMRANQDVVMASKFTVEKEVKSREELEAALKYSFRLTKENFEALGQHATGLGKLFEQAGKDTAKILGPIYNTQQIKSLGEMNQGLMNTASFIDSIASGDFLGSWMSGASSKFEDLTKTLNSAMVPMDPWSQAQRRQKQEAEATSDALSMLTKTAKAAAVGLGGSVAAGSGGSVSLVGHHEGTGNRVIVGADGRLVGQGGGLGVLTSDSTANVFKEAFKVAAVEASNSSAGPAAESAANRVLLQNGLLAGLSRLPNTLLRYDPNALNKPLPSAPSPPSETQGSSGAKAEKVRWMLPFQIALDKQAIATGVAEAIEEQDLSNVSGRFPR